MAIFILEGPDGAGKTTLAVELSKRLGYPVVKFNKPVSIEESFAQFDTYAEFLDTNDNMIFDRSWYSDFVYGAVMNDRDGWHVITAEEVKALEAIGRDKIIIIHCNSSVETLWSRCDKRGEEYVTSFGQMLEIREGYITLFKNRSVPVISYDF